MTWYRSTRHTKRWRGFRRCPIWPALADRVHTLTVYVGPHHIVPLIDDIVAARPRRVILNPGTESEELQRTLNEHGIPWLQACTLVLLATGQFESAAAPATGS